MKVLPRVGLFALPFLAIALCVTGCHKTAAQIAADTNQAGTQDQATDPASANLVPVEAATTPAAAPGSATSSPAPSSPAPAVAGDFASMNPYANVLAGSGGF